MYRIDPCCAKRHLLNLRNAIGNNGTADFEGYEDMSLTELLPALLGRYDQIEMMIVAPSLPDQAAEVISTCMNMQRSLMDGKGNVDVISHLTIIADISSDSSSDAALWLKKNPFGNRLTLIDRQQPDTAILLPDIAVYGPINLRYGRHFTATATTVPEMVERLWSKYRKETEPEPEPVPVEDEYVEKEEPELQAPKISSKKKKKD